jgi:Ohr subfamily peroxiredoxin
VEVTAHIGLGPRAEGGFGLTAKLEIDLKGVAEAEARELVDAAHQICPYSNAVRGNVDVELSIIS